MGCELKVCKCEAASGWIWDQTWVHLVFLARRGFNKLTGLLGCGYGLFSYSHVVGTAWGLGKHTCARVGVLVFVSATTRRNVMVAYFFLFKLQVFFW